MEELNKFIHLNRIQTGDSKILDDEIKSYFSKYSILKEKYYSLLNEKEYPSLRPWLLKALKDQEACVNCTNYFSCPKKSRRGYFYEMDLEKVEVINKVCSKRKEVYKYRPHFIYGEERYEDCFNIYFQMFKVPELIGNPKTDFFRAAREVYLAIKGKSRKQFYIKTNDDNKKILAYFGLAYGLKDKQNCIYIDPNLRLNYLRIDNNQDDLEELLRLQKQIHDARIIVIDNFDAFKRYTTSFDNMVLPLIKAACSDDKILILTGTDDFINTITPLTNFAKPNAMLMNTLADIKLIAFKEPVIYNI